MAVNEIKRYGVSVTQLPRDFVGLAADVKPTVIPNSTVALPVGSTYFAKDTGIGYIWDGVAWFAA